jgi:hypothetical protein
MLGRMGRLEDEREAIEQYEQVCKRLGGRPIGLRDPAAFVDALAAAADDKAARIHKGANASALGRAQFDRANAAPAFVAWLEAAAPRHAPIASSVPGSAQG